MSPRFEPASITELQRVGLLATLPGEVLRRLAARMEREYVPAGQAVVEEGDRGNRFYVVLEGLFSVTQESMGERRLLRPGDVFGEVALAMDVPRTASVRAIVPATVASCDRVTFDEFIRPLYAEDPRAGAVIELWQAEWCPYSRRVRIRLTELGVDFVARQVEAKSPDRNRMREATGFDSIPVLVPEEGEPIGDFKEILAWLDAHYPETAETDRQRAQLRGHGIEPTRRDGDPD